MDKQVQWDVKALVKAVGGVASFRKEQVILGLAPSTRDAVRQWVTRGTASSAGIAALIFVVEKKGLNASRFLKIVDTNGRGAEDHGEDDAEAA